MADAVDAYLLLGAAARLFEKPGSELTAEERQQTVALAEKEQLMQQKILGSEEAAGISVSDEEVATARAEIAGRYPSHGDYLEALARNGMNETSLSASLVNTLRVGKVMQQVAAAVSVGDEEVKDYYHANTAKFERPELREARHILITINSRYPENRRKAVKQRLQKIAAELSEKPEAFADLAMRHSECPTALEGGSLGKVPAGKLYAALDAVLSGMAEGETSGMIESPMGMHLLRCDRIHAAGIAPLEEAAPIIRAHLLKSRISKAQKQWIRSLFDGEAL